MTSRVYYTIVATLMCSFAYCQKLLDPCFASIGPLGKFRDSQTVANVCNCNDAFLSSNLIEWDGQVWQGQLDRTNVKRPPPEGCNVRGLWMGYSGWTGNGEAFGLLIDQPIEAKKTYTFTFTYARDGLPNDQSDFSPIVYTNHWPSLYQAVKVGRMPATIDWTTQSITFVASSTQRGHQWLIVHAVESSGTVLSACSVNDPIQDKVILQDTTLCLGNSIVASAYAHENYSYLWNTGSEESKIVISEPGVYTVKVTNYKCESYDTVTVKYEDCEVRFVMPNVFTPNNDNLNEVFKPIDYNYVDLATMKIYNRWGNEIFRGDVFNGWDGKDAAPGIYYYELIYIDRHGTVYNQKGPLSLVR